MSASGLCQAPKSCLSLLPGSEAAGRAQVPTLLARGHRPLHPPTLHMVIEALEAQGQDQKKGVSVVAIKRFILSKYPAVDPIRLKYLLKQALCKGLSHGDLVRPHNSSAMGATGRFKLAPKKPQKKRSPGQADPDRGQAPEAGGKGSSKTLQAPTAGGTKEEKPLVAKKPAAVKKPKAKLVDVSKSCSRPPMAAAAKNTGRGPDTAPAGAAAEQPREAPAGQSKRKAPKAVQKDPLEAKRGPGKAGKPRVTPGAGKGKAAPKAADRKAP
ncbi:histone H1.8 [Indicator indicator]|uniref:histone H1.8 n=1 Tax=Indicator indicator TaxID=1002788 RepID=UPI0023DE774A|nr:histone H1.8 [Indicator indicator]